MVAQLIELEVQPVLLPRIMSSTTNELLVLFTSPDSGWVLFPEDECFEYDTGMYVLTNTDEWKEYDGVVRLSNKEDASWYTAYHDAIRNAEDQKMYPLPYPVLMKSKQSDLVVLFFSEYEGVAVTVGEDHQPGDYCEDWSSVLQEADWEVFDGIVELKN